MVKSSLVECHENIKCCGRIGREKFRRYWMRKVTKVAADAFDVQEQQDIIQRVDIAKPKL